MAAREPFVSSIGRRAVAREAVIFMLVSAVIGSIGYATAACRANRPVTAEFTKTARPGSLCDGV
jgi:hypothetical protein